MRLFTSTNDVTMKMEVEVKRKLFLLIESKCLEVEYADDGN